VSGSDSISPTAHYTGYVWARNGLSHPELTTTEGRLLFESLQPLMRLSGVLHRPYLEPYLLARHRAIDALLERAIEEHGITQVVEVAAGLSPRGWRFTERYGEKLTYIEADLPAMADRKRRALERMDSLSERHQVRDLDALRESGPDSLAELVTDLDPGAGLAIITEGLLGYLSPENMKALWRRFAGVLSGFASGRYISDLHLGTAQTPDVRAFRVVLSAFVRGRVYLHFDDAEQAADELRRAGFAEATVTPANQIITDTDPAGRQLAHILEASTLSSALSA
jgi:O-methyltransferase involved in polyketide biosynthesis